MKSYEERLAYQKEYQKRYRELHKEELNRKQREYKKVRDKKLKEEIKAIKEAMHFRNNESETLLQIDEFTYMNSSSKNKAILYRNDNGQWYYEVFYRNSNNTYISRLFNTKVQAIKDMRVAI